MSSLNVHWKFRLASEHLNATFIAAAAVTERRGIRVYIKKYFRM
jgi:hypothetical protein